MDALRTLWLAIKDLIKYDKNIDLAFGFANVRIINKNLTVCFLPELSDHIGAPTFENKMAR